MRKINPLITFYVLTFIFYAPLLVFILQFLFQLITNPSLLFDPQLGFNAFIQSLNNPLLDNLPDLIYAYSFPPDFVYRGLFLLFVMLGTFYLYLAFYMVDRKYFSIQRKKAVLFLATIGITIPSLFFVFQIVTSFLIHGSPI